MDLSLMYTTPDSVWDGMLRGDFRAWETVQAEPAITTAATQAAYGQELVREAFLGLFVPSAKLAPEVSEPLVPMGKLFQRAETMPEWQTLRQETGDDEVSSALGAASFTTELCAHLPPEVQEKIQAAAEAARQADDLETQAQTLKEMLANLPAGDPLKQGAQQKAKQAAKQAAAARRAAQQQAQAFTQALEASQAQVQNALAQASQSSSEQIQELRQAAQALGGGEAGGSGWGLEAGAGGQTTLAGVQKLADYLEQNKGLRQMLKELGWARRAVGEKMRQARHGRAVFTHYKTAELDFETLCPEELMGLVMPAGHPAQIDFMRRAGNDELLHRMFSGEEKAGRGPLVLVLDTSGSMSGAPHALQAAFALALLQAMRREKRRMVIIPFSGARQFQVWEPTADTSLDEMVRMIEFGYWGGTEPYGPLRKAIEIIHTDAQMRHGDILISTDGVFGSPPADFLKMLEQARQQPGLRLAALVIGTAAGEAGFADSVRVVQDLLTEREELAGLLEDIL